MKLDVVNISLWCVDLYFILLSAWFDKKKFLNLYAMNTLLMLHEFLFLTVHGFNFIWINLGGIASGWPFDPSSTQSDNAVVEGCTCLSWCLCCGYWWQETGL